MRVSASQIGATFRANLEAFLDADGRSRTDIAGEAFEGTPGTAHRALNRLMSGEAEPSHARLAGLCDALARAPADFYMPTQ